MPISPGHTVNPPPPAHYAPGRFGVECIHVTRLMTFAAGNAVKYLWRFRAKGGTDDLRKSLDYLRWAAVDHSRGTGVWLGGAEKLAGQLLLEQWVSPFIDEDHDVEQAIMLVSAGEIGAAIERVAAELR